MEEDGREKITDTNKPDTQRKKNNFALISMTETVLGRKGSSNKNKQTSQQTNKYTNK